MNTNEAQNHVQALLAAGQADQAIAFVNGRLEKEPSDGPMLFALGTAFLYKKQHGIAINHLLSATSNGYDVYTVHNNLGNALRASCHEDAAEAAWKEAIHKMRQSGHLDADVFNNMATICINSNRAREAEAWCRKCLSVDPKHPHGLWNLSLSLLEQGKFGEGWDLHWHGFVSGGRLNKQYDCKVWEGEKVKRLVVFGEQGQGDEILFASMIPDVLELCGELILDCHPRLEDIFKRSFDCITYPTRKSPDSSWIYKHYPVDAKIAMGDLGKIFRRKLGDFPYKTYKPYLKTSPAFDYALEERLKGDKPKIGIAWEGGTQKTHENQRTPPFGYFKDLIESIDADWISLHYRKDAEEQLKGLPVHHWQAPIDNLDCLFSLAKACDVVVTVDQTLVHQCGAVGARVAVLLPVECSWRYPPTSGETDLSETMIWYGDNVKLLRQEKPGDWGPVFAKLKTLLGARHGYDQPGIPGPTERISQAAE